MRGSRLAQHLLRTVESRWAAFLLVVKYQLYRKKLTVLHMRASEMPLMSGSLYWSVKIGMALPVALAQKSGRATTATHVMATQPNVSASTRKRRMRSAIFFFS